MGETIIGMSECIIDPYESIYIMRIIITCMCIDRYCKGIYRYTL